MDQKQKVLIIDDEAAVREAVIDILDLEGLSVFAAQNGEQGIDLYAEHQHEIALVILDLSMPGLSGQETLVRLQEIDPQVQVLLSSGYSEIEMKGRFTTSGVAGFLQKPYNALLLIDTVKEYLAA